MYLFCFNHSTWGNVYLHKISPLASFPKSQGAIITISLSLIQTLLFNFPLIRPRLVMASLHFTITFSPPIILITRPNISSSPGNGSCLDTNLHTHYSVKVLLFFCSGIVLSACSDLLKPICAVFCTSDFLEGTAAHFVKFRLYEFWALHWNHSFSLDPHADQLAKVRNSATARP